MEEQNFPTGEVQRKQNKMADLSEKYQDNVDGRYFVDEQCIDCDLCREVAPVCFTRNDDAGHSFVFKQPETMKKRNCVKKLWIAVPLRPLEILEIYKNEKTNINTIVFLRV